jgi:ribonuclease PH
MRIDGRRPDQLRPVKMDLHFTRYAEGSVLISQGNTRVLCNATVDEKVPRWLQEAGEKRGWVTAEYAMLPRSTHTRTQRETITPQSRTMEIRRLVGRSLRAAVDLRLLGQRQVILDCDVLQADGGTRTAAVTGGYVALALALRRLIKAGEVSPQVLLSPVAAVSVGMVDGQPMLDLCYEEDCGAQVDMNLVMNRQGRVIELQGAAEQRPFDRATLNALLDLAGDGIGSLLEAQEEALSR